MDDHDEAPAKVVFDVHMADLPVQPRRGVTNALNDKQYRWTDAQRNQAIANIAQLLLRRDHVALGQFGLFTTCDQLPLVVRSCSWLAILVESIPHASQVATLLPRFEVQARDHQPMSAAGMQVPYCSITTLVAAQRCVQFMPTIVINAIGGPFIPLFDQLVPVGPTHSMVVIDLEDAECDLAERYTDSRVRRYEQLGHQVVSHRNKREVSASPIVLRPYRRGDAEPEGPTIITKRRRKSKRRK